MAFGGFNDNRPSAPMAEINVTPMVDVMLVLLVIFILAAPLFTHALKLELPAAASNPAATRPATVTLAIDADGILYWNDAIVAADALPARLAAAAALRPQPDLQLRADRATRYEVIARVMSAAQANGLTQIGFVTDPTAQADPVNPSDQRHGVEPVAATSRPQALQLSPVLTPSGGR